MFSGLKWRVYFICRLCGTGFAKHVRLPHRIGIVKVMDNLLSFYFPHDTSASHDPKMISLRINFWYKGVGMYWNIIEALHREKDGKIHESLLHCMIVDFFMQEEIRTQQHQNGEAEQFEKFLLDTNVLRVDEERMIYCDRVMRNLDERRQKSDKARQSVEARWNKGKNTNVIREKYERNTIKERKGKENKVNTNTDTEIVASTKNENEIFFENIQNNTDTILDNMNIPDEHRDRAREELFKFWNYWTEKDMRGKERWRKEKTFEVQRRLTTWLMNTKQFTNKNYEKPKFTR